MDRAELKGFIARRVARELRDGDFVNLGIGLPTLVPSYLPDNVHVTLQAEVGMVGAGQAPTASHLESLGVIAAPLDSGSEFVDADPRYIVDAGGGPASINLGGAFIDSVTSFALIRGGHVDATVLGALQVDALGNLANWIIPGKMVPGMGGAMDLVVGARRVIVAMEHTQKGAPKILTRCTLPLTAVHCVDLIVTEMGVFTVDQTGLTLTEIAPDITVDDVRAATEAPFAVAADLKLMV